MFVRARNEAAAGMLKDESRYNESYAPCGWGILCCYLSSIKLCHENNIAVQWMMQVTWRHVFLFVLFFIVDLVWPFNHSDLGDNWKLGHLAQQWKMQMIIKDFNLFWTYCFCSDIGLFLFFLYFISLEKDNKLIRNNCSHWLSFVRRSHLNSWFVFFSIFNNLGVVHFLNK